MPAQIFSIPLVSGMNQAASTAIGEPRLMRCERARLIEPGKFAVSPGYFYGSPAANMRACHQAGDNLCVVSSSGGNLYSTTAGRTGSSIDHQFDWKLPAFEPPIRVDMPGGLRTQTTAYWIAPTDRAYDPTGWYALSMVYTSSVTLEQTTLSIFDGTSLMQQVALEASVTKFWRVALDATSGIGWLLQLDTVAHKLKVYYVGAGTIPTSLNITLTCYATGIRDAACLTVSSQLYFCVLGIDGNVYTSYGISYTQFSVGSDASEISMFTSGGSSTLLLRTDPTGHVQTYDFVSGASDHAEITLASGGIGKCSLSKIPRSGVFVATLEKTDVTTGHTNCECFVIPVGIGSLVSVSLGTEAKSVYSFGAPLQIEVQAAYQLLVNQSSVSRSAMVRRVPDNVSGVNVTLAAVAASGELPLRAQLSQGSGTYASCSPIPIYIRDSLCAEKKLAYVFAFPRAVGGNLAGNCDLGVSAIVCATDSTAMPTGGHSIVSFDALGKIAIDGGSVAFLAAHPWIDGDDQVATGFRVDGPTPVVSPNDAASGTSIFADGEVYQYVVRAEYRDASGTLYRSPPTEPISYTVVANSNPSYTQHLSHNVAISWMAEAPSMPGMLLRLYRTVANGTVFYDTGSPILSLSSTLVDSTSNTSLILNSLLTEGSAVSGGLKAKYGFPPCRFGWRGKDRVIVGGLENPTCVRWSQLVYPGEAVCFPHASELGWVADFHDDVTAVASLDDAWIVFSRGQIWTVFGSGPEDNGTNGAFESPRLLSADCGCLTWKSVAEIAEGLLFQATDAQIYLLRRGQLTIEWYSAAVQVELSRGLLGSILRNPIVATVVHPTSQTIHFIRAAMPDGTDSPPLVFDRRTSCWSLDGDGVSEGLKGAISGSAILDTFSLPVPATETVCILTPTYLTVENATGGVVAPIQGTWTALIETNDIAPFGIAGWGKVSRIGLVSNSSANTTYALSSWRDRNQSVTADDTATLTLSDSGGADFPFLQRAPAVDKCSAVRVRLEWSDRATYPAAMLLRVEPSADAQRTSTTRRT